jgi:hypothetical protein
MFGGIGDTIAIQDRLALACSSSIRSMNTACGADAMSNDSVTVCASIGCCGNAWLVHSAVTLRSCGRSWQVVQEAGGLLVCDLDGHEHHLVERRPLYDERVGETARRALKIRAASDGGQRAAACGADGVGLWDWQGRANEVEKYIATTPGAMRRGAALTRRES